MIEIHGTHHVGVTVPDMAEAVRFFERVFGAVTVVTTGPVDVDDTYMTHRLGVPAGRRITDIRVLRCGNGTNVELFEYAGEAPTPVKQNSEVGGFHIAFQVDDADAAAARLREGGVDVLEGPTYVDDGPLEGLTWVYLRTPWGQYLELVSTARRLAGEAGVSTPLWYPKEPA